MERKERHSISVKAVALGITLFTVVGPLIIVALGFARKYVDGPDWYPGGFTVVTGKTPFFWLGLAIMAFGFICLIVGLIGSIPHFIREWKKEN